MISKILKLLLNNNFAIIETLETDKNNPKPYEVRKVVKLKAQPEVYVNGKLLKD